MDFQQKPSSINDTDAIARSATLAGALRIGGWFFLAVALICGGVIAQVIAADFYVRTHWPRVEGEVLSAEPKSTRVSTRDRRPTLFWVEFEVEFDPEASGCNTGRSWAVAMRFPCIATVRSPQSSWGTPFDWIKRHPAGSRTRLYYDPKTGHLRFADEPISNLYPWGTIALFLLASCASIIFFHASRRPFTRSSYRGVNPTKDELTRLNLS